jgi:hypothetical protein
MYDGNWKRGHKALPDIHRGLHMATDPETLQLAKAIISLLARTHFPEARLRSLVLPRRSPAKYLKAYNSCDGSRTRAEVAKLSGIDKDNFSKTAARWIEVGVLFELGPGRSTRLLHLYPIADASTGVATAPSQPTTEEQANGNTS